MSHGVVRVPRISLRHRADNAKHSLGTRERHAASETLSAGRRRLQFHVQSSDLVNVSYCSLRSPGCVVDTSTAKTRYHGCFATSNALVQETMHCVKAKALTYQET